MNVQDPRLARQQIFRIDSAATAAILAIPSVVCNRMGDSTTVQKKPWEAAELTFLARDRLKVFP
jgi:hypothetical protein